MTAIAHTEVLESRVEFFNQRFVRPLRLSSGLIESISEARATVRVRCGEQEGEGWGSIYLSDLWAWPDPALAHPYRDDQMRRYCEKLSEDLPSLVGSPAHPLELGLRLHAHVHADAGPLPLLAKSVCASPFDAAIHDASGRAIRKSAFTFYEESSAVSSADHLFPKGAIRAVADTLRHPPASLTGWWIANADDNLQESFGQAIRERGFYAFKIKLLGKSARADAERTAAVYRAARRHGVASPKLSGDSNEANPDPDSVLDYLDELRKVDTEAFEALQYLEQPTARDICAFPCDWRQVGEIKPIILDEGLTSLELLPLAIEQGWKGIALKTCKGHSFTLVAAAWAHQHGLLLTMQDLTNPGLSAIHSFQTAAHLPVINGIELNSPQFTPEANAAWLPDLAELFLPTDGEHRLSGPFEGLGLTSQNALRQ